MIGSPALAQVAIRGGKDAGDHNALVVVFLRGGADGLNIVAPLSDDAYYKARPTLALARPNDQRVGDADRARKLDDFFALHPALDPLLPLYMQGELGVVHAVGSSDESHSHFEAMSAMERGLAKEGPGDASGWLARHLSSTASDADSPLRAVAIGGTAPDSLRGATSAVALNSLADFQLQGDSTFERALVAAYGEGGDVMTAAGRETLRVLQTLRELPEASGGDGYPGGSSLGEALRQVATLIKAGVGLEVACVDAAGWDTHVAQGVGTGWMAGLLRELGQSLAAFHQDLGPAMRRVTVVVQTEFGRRVHENSGLGTDHGHGSVMLLLGGGVNGGKVHGQWPGLENLAGPGDLAVTTDYRDVLAELLRVRLHNSNHQAVFPGLRHRPVGAVA